MISEHLPNIKGLIIDMDGVLWHDTQPIGDLPAIFAQIQSSGLKTILATNNTTKTIDEFHQKLRDFGVVLEEWQVINSSQALGALLQEKYPHGADIYVIGQPSLKNTLSEFGFRIVTEQEDAHLVVSGLDYTLTFDKLKHAYLLIRNGCEYFATNGDATYPTLEGLIPGSGSIVAALETASGRKAKIVGKPSPDLYEIALKRLQLPPEETLAIGDRLETDIVGAQVAGIHTALVLTGASTLDQLKNFQPKPDIVAEDLTDLIF
jgi:4-nitrophenyl phosphatase